MKDVNEEKEWFADWFESPYYDLLYSKRDEREAALFLDNLLVHCPLPAHARILDLPCGKGRHSVYLNQKGFTVVGADLSKRSIAFARQFETSNLHFFEHDMRAPLPEHGFDLALNLFTSFGYFDNPEDNLKVLRSIHSALKPNGMFVLDYLNGFQTQRQLISKEEKQVGNARFDIERKIENGFIVKNIKLHANGDFQRFQEKVRLFTLEEFQQMFALVNLKIEKVAGDYSLTDFNIASSDRMILIATKN